MKRRTLQNIIRFLLRTISVTEYTGLEHIPLSGPVLITTNHLSQLDIGVLFGNPRRPDITALVTTKYLDHALIRWFTDTAEGIWIDRERADFGAFRAAVDALQRGVAVGISPEGTRSKTGRLLQGKPGAVLLGLKTGAPIVPVGLAGTETGAQRLKHLRKPHMVARFGPAYHIPPFHDRERSAELKRWTDEMMCRIAVLLPPQYRGYYRDHPRLKELFRELKDLPFQE
jgi:1-acyl-sn-glycerol-3-phosphate acyltransferase